MRQLQTVHAARLACRGSVGGGVHPFVLHPFGEALEPVGEGVQLADPALVETDVAGDFPERIRNLGISDRVMDMSRHRNLTP